MRLKSIPGIFIFLLFCTESFAMGNISLDGAGAFTQTMDAKNQVGGGGALLYQVADDFNIFAKGIYNQRKIEDEATTKNNEYKYFMGIAGVEYLYNIKKLPLFWKNSAGVGAGKVSIKEDYGWNTTTFRNEYLTDKSDTGLCVAAWTGILYMFTQGISGYIDLGVHKTYFFNDLKDDNIMGFQALIGVRFTLWGVNKSIYSEY
ncbi:MAG: hypothetical protein V1874_03585 [Spirochaetota bacterium]